MPYRKYVEDADEGNMIDNDTDGHGRYGHVEGADEGNLIDNDTDGHGRFRP